MQTKLFIWAAGNGHKDIVQALLDNGASVNEKNNFGNTALILAAEKGHKDIVEALLDKGASVNEKNNNGYTALILAIQKGHTEIVKALLEKGVNIDINVRDNSDSTALMWAAQSGHKDIVQALLANNAKVNVQNNNGYTALIVAVYEGHTEVVEKLLANGANVNEKDKNGKTVLMYAAQKGHTEEVKALLAQGADFSCIGPSYKDYELILKYLAGLDIKIQAECLRKIPGGPYDDIWDYVAVEKPLYFNSLFEAPNASHGAIEILSEMHFDEHINKISEHYALMREKSLSNSNYTEAVVAAKTLLIACGQAKRALFQSNPPSKENIETFQKACKDAIEQARPVLEKYRSWAKLLVEFLFALGTLFLSHALGLFSVKTKSEQLIDKLNEAVTVNPKKNS